MYIAAPLGSSAPDVPFEASKFLKRIQVQKSVSLVCSAQASPPPSYRYCKEHKSRVLHMLQVRVEWCFPITKFVQSHSVILYKLFLYKYKSCVLSYILKQLVRGILHVARYNTECSAYILVGIWCSNPAMHRWFNWNKAVTSLFPIKVPEHTLGSFSR